MLSSGRRSGSNGLLGLLGRGRRLLLALERLALLGHVGSGLGLGLLRVDEDILVVNPQLVGQPDGQGGGLGTLDVDALDVAPLLRHPLLDEGRGNGVNIVGNLLRGPASVADADGGVGRGAEADEGRADSLFHLPGNLLGGAGVDVTLGLLGPLAALASDLGGLGLQDDGDGALLGGLVKGLAEEAGQAVDDAVVAEEEVVLGVQLALGVVLGELGLEVGDVDDAADALAQGLGEGGRGDNVLVGALRVGGDEADGQVLVRVERVRQRNLAGLQAGLVGNVALGGQRQPDGRLGGEAFLVVFIGEQVALVGGLGGFLGGLLDV